MASWRETDVGRQSAQERILTVELQKEMSMWKACTFRIVFFLFVLSVCAVLV